MAGKNTEQEHYFVGGMKRDTVNNVEDPKTYFFGVNGRLYSNNGKLSFSSIEGKKTVYSDNKILKYLGYCAFKDELLLMVKISNDQNNLLQPSQPVTESITSTYPPTNTVTPAEIDYSDLYELVNDGFYGEICEETTVTEELDSLDAFLSIKKENGVLVGEYLWVGNMNWNFNSKINTIGVHENNSYKRVYLTDYVNTFKVVNILNGKIENLSAEQFNVFQQFSLSQPLISAVTEGGSLKSSVVFYTYRLISKDGQRTVFSDLSERVPIYPGTTGLDIRGGDVSEDTGKKVKIKIINEKTNIYDKIEVVAIVYEAEGAPTSIKSIGVQDLETENIFYHSGNEAGYDLNITLSDITEKNTGWRFCSDLKTKKNKLIVSGLRNTPIPFTLTDIEKDFILKAFDSKGSTFNNSFINPDPKKFRFIPKTGSIGSYKKKKTYIREIKVFGTFTFTLKYQNKEYKKDFIKENNYNNVTKEIWEFINSIKQNFTEFHFTYLNQDIIIAPSSTANLDDLKFLFTTEEVSITADFEYDFTNQNITTQLIHGYQSFGFEKGNGIRITFKPEFQDLMQKSGPFMSMNYDYSNNFIYDEKGRNNLLANSYSFNRQNLFNLKENKFKRGLFKGEIYRLGLQFERNGENIFTLPIGDIMVPEIGDNVLTLENQEITVWGNSRVKDNILQGILTNLLVDIRLNCDFKNTYTSVKVVYVQRTVENRTIICQGLSGPLVRYNQFVNTSIQLNSNVARKWQLPFMGGPGIDVRGVRDFKEFGENLAAITNQKGRVLVHSKLMYLDAPEILFDRIPAGSITTGKVQVVAKVWGDHQGAQYLGHGRIFETAETFSQKIYSTVPVSGRKADSGTVYPNSHGLVGQGDLLPPWVNVTIFSETTYLKNKISTGIYKSKIMAKGEILGGAYLDSTYEISNNAMTLFQPLLFYSNANRYPEVKQGKTNFEAWKSNRHCIGARTMFLKTNDEVFNELFFDNLMVGAPDEGTFGDIYSVDAAFIKHAVVNIVKDNADTIYGGRTELAYSRNVYIPMSKTIAVSKKLNKTIRIKVEGDTYCSLFFNNKTQYADYAVERIHMNHAGGGVDGVDKDKDYDDIPKRTGAWAYGVVLESTVDIALARGLKFYQNSGAVDLKKTTDKINEVYFQEGTLRKYIPKPLDFKDDPDLLHIIATSDPKVMGSPIDNWTNFRVNNFYELEKDKGAAFNLGKSLDDVYAIQERQTSRLLLNERNASLNSSDGKIMFKTGDGTGVDGHQVVSDYGTSIRRNVTEITSSIKGAAGFYFYDERKNEIVKITEGVLLKEDLAYYVNKLLENNKVYDVEGYYDDLNKETVIRTRTENGSYLTYSYNELFGVMNGFYEFDNDQYFMWNNEVYSPKKDTMEIEQHNKGVCLRFSGDDKSMKIGVVTNISPTKVKIFHNFMANINIDYPIEKIEIKTSSGQTRVIDKTHHRYKIREGLHTVPLKNQDDWSDLRGEWMELTIEIKNLKNKKIDIFSITNFVRLSTV